MVINHQFATVDREVMARWRSWYEKEVVEQWGATIVDPLVLPDPDFCRSERAVHNQSTADRHIARDPRLGLFDNLIDTR